MAKADDYYYGDGPFVGVTNSGGRRRAATNARSPRGKYVTVTPAQQRNRAVSAAPSPAMGMPSAAAVTLSPSGVQLPPLTPNEKAFLIQRARESSIALVDHAHTLDGPVQWHFTGKYRGIQMYRGEGSADASVPNTMEFLCGVTTMVGTIEEVSRYFDQPTTQTMRAKKAPDELDCAVLYSLVYGDPMHPHYRVAVKYTSYEGPSSFSRPRDYCYLECQDTFRHSSGRRGWVLSMHSIKLPCCPELEGIVRGSMYHSGYVFVEAEKPGYMDVMHSLQINFKGTNRLPQFLLNSALKRRITSVIQISREIQMVRMGHQPLLEKKDLVPKNQRHLCLTCSRKFTLFVRKTRCRVCGEVVCQTCAPQVEVSIPGQPMSKTRICTRCHTKSPASLAPVLDRRGGNETQYSENTLQAETEDDDEEDDDHEPGLDGLEEQGSESVFAQSRFTVRSSTASMMSAPFKLDDVLNAGDDRSSVASSAFWNESSLSSSTAFDWNPGSIKHDSGFDPQSSTTSSNFFNTSQYLTPEDTDEEIDKRAQRYQSSSVRESTRSLARPSNGVTQISTNATLAALPESPLDSSPNAEQPLIVSGLDARFLKEMNRNTHMNAEEVRNTAHARKVGRATNGLRFEMDDAAKGNTLTSLSESEHEDRTGDNEVGVHMESNVFFDDYVGRKPSEFLNRVRANRSKTIQFTPEAPANTGAVTESVKDYMPGEFMRDPTPSEFMRDHTPSEFIRNYAGSEIMREIEKELLEELDDIVANARPSELDRPSNMSDFDPSSAYHPSIGSVPKLTPMAAVPEDSRVPLPIVSVPQYSTYVSNEDNPNMQSSGTTSALVQEPREPSSFSSINEKSSEPAAASELSRGPTSTAANTAVSASSVAAKAPGLSSFGSDGKTSKLITMSLLPTASSGRPVLNPSGKLIRLKSDTSWIRRSSLHQSSDTPMDTGVPVVATNDKNTYSSVAGVDARESSFISPPLDLSESQPRVSSPRDVTIVLRNSGVSRSSTDYLERPSSPRSTTVFDEELMNRPTDVIMEQVNSRRHRPMGNVQEEEFRSTEIMRNIEDAHRKRMEELNRIAMDATGNRISTLMSDNVEDDDYNVEIPQVRLNRSRTIEFTPEEYSPEVDYRSTEIMQSIEEEHRKRMSELNHFAVNHMGGRISKLAINEDEEMDTFNDSIRLTSRSPMASPRRTDASLEFSLEFQPDMEQLHSSNGHSRLRNDYPSQLGSPRVAHIALEDDGVYQRESLVILGRMSSPRGSTIIMDRDSSVSMTSILDEDLINRPTDLIMEQVSAHRNRPKQQMYISEVEEDYRNTEAMLEIEEEHRRRMAELNRIAMDNIGNRISSFSPEEEQTISVVKRENERSGQSDDWRSTEMMENYQMDHESKMALLRRQVRELEEECRETIASVLTPDEMNFPEPTDKFTTVNSGMKPSKLIRTSTFGKKNSLQEEPTSARSLYEQIAELTKLQSQMVSAKTDGDEEEFRERIKEQYRMLRSIKERHRG